MEHDWHLSCTIGTRVMVDEWHISLRDAMRAASEFIDAEDLPSGTHVLISKYPWEVGNVDTREPLQIVRIVIEEH